MGTSKVELTGVVEWGEVGCSPSTSDLSWPLVFHSVSLRTLQSTCCKGLVMFYTYNNRLFQTENTSRMCAFQVKPGYVSVRKFIQRPYSRHLFLAQGRSVVRMGCWPGLDSLRRESPPWMLLAVSDLNTRLRGCSWGESEVEKKIEHMIFLFLQTASGMRTSCSHFADPTF